MKLRDFSFRFVDRIRFLTELCRGKEVLNLGCADATRVDLAIDMGAHVHLELEKVALRLVGIDSSQEALKVLSRHVNSQLVCQDVENLSALTGLGEFDVVVCGELIEHLNNPGRMLDGVRRILRLRGELAISTPNAFSLKFLTHAFIRQADVSSDHHSMLHSPRTLRTLLRRYGFIDSAWMSSQWYLPTRRSRIGRPLFGTLYGCFHSMQTL